ncbi:MAG TPA: hypothetical protein PLI62_19405 [Spirochaetota bacterium]|nr:hypothetical protein [Spirochaetota bacterium]
MIKEYIKQNVLLPGLQRNGILGLEADAVVIMDVMEPGSKLNFTGTDFYVACSRAKHLLAVIEREKGVSGL